MKFEYRDYELSNAIIDIAAGPFGSNLKVSCFTETGFPIIDGANLKGITVTDNITKFVSEDKARSLHRSIAKRRDIVVTISGNVGQISYIPDNSQYAEYLCSQRQFRVTFDESKIYVPYLVYYLHSVEGRSKILAFANQTGVPALSQPLKNFRKIKIDLPSLENQHKIADILSTLDEKIATNRAINENLYAQAKAIKRQWVAKNKDRYELLPLIEVAAINPDTYSPKEAWEYVNYLDTSSITNGFIADIQHIVPSIEKLPSRARRKVAAGDVLFSTVRPNQNHFGIISDPLSNMLASTGFAAIRSKNPLVCNELIYLCLTELDFIEKMQQLAEQSTSTFPSIKPSDLGTCQIPCPKDESSDVFTYTLKSLFALIAANFRENSSLATMREALLPKLMSGEIDVSAVQL